VGGAAGGGGARGGGGGGGGRAAPPPPPPRTKWTRRVPHLVLIGHAASLSQVEAERLGRLAVQFLAAATAVIGARRAGS